MSFSKEPLPRVTITDKGLIIGQIIMIMVVCLMILRAVVCLIA